MLQKIIRGLIFIIVLLLIGYIIVIKMPQASVGSKEVVAELSAGEIYNAFSNDESSAEQKYLGKAVIVSGIIDDKYEDENGAPVVILNADDGSAAVLATLETSEQDKIKGYKIKDRIRVKALCSGLLMEVTLNKGVIME